MSTKRPLIFNPGPAALPLPALERTRDELLDFEGTGMSVLEVSHRAPAYEKVHREAMALVRELLAVPESHAVLFMAGGARTQFALVPTNLLGEGTHGAYAVTGHWSKCALKEASFVGEARVSVDVEADGTFVRVPDPAEVAVDAGAAYLHLTSNNTLYGTQWHAYPEVDAPLVADMTSDLLSRKLDVGRFGLIYAAAQKNLGPAGVTVVVVDRALVEGARTDIPAAFRYASFLAKDSLWNTPPTFAIHVLRNTLAYLADRGGVEALEATNRAKAARVYAAVASRPDLFTLPAEEGSRSLCNVVFRGVEDGVEARLLAEAEARGMVGLKGHRTVGGLRASLYNGVEAAWVEALAELIEGF
jgi:phosphoserine aminotransferase